MVKNFFRSLFYPGLDLHLRNRQSLCEFWKCGPRDVLDAGSGNGYFSWLAYKSGGRVTAMNFEKYQVDRAEEYFLNYRKVDPKRMQFEHYNLYDLPKESRQFDEIICYETLEHIRGDDRVVAEFYRILKPGGYLHVCCPFASHPRHRAEILDEAETGGHVRPGYSEESYRRLLEPLGFKIDQVVGIGTPGVYRMDAVMRFIRNRFGDWPAVPLFPVGWLIVRMARFNPKVPFSIYVRAVKPGS